MSERLRQSRSLAVFKADIPYSESITYKQQRSLAKDVIKAAYRDVSTVEIEHRFDSPDFPSSGDSVIIYARVGRPRGVDARPDSELSKKKLKRRKYLRFANLRTFVPPPQGLRVAQV